MERSDFMQRGELKVDFLRLWVFVEPWARWNYDLGAADLKLLLFLEPMNWFMVKDFKEGTLWLTWDRKRFYKMQKAGWIEKTHSGRGRIGGHNKYKVSQKGVLLVRRIYKMLIGKEDIPESAKRNQRIKSEGHTELIKKINQQTKKDYGTTN